MKKLSHINDQGKAKMVDVSAKKDQLRTAKATGDIKINRNTIKLIKENKIKKGDVLSVAEIAGIQAAKQTSNLIPLCHPLTITKIEVNTEIKEYGISATSLIRSKGQTGVEMEALTAVSITLLTIYDMCKATDKGMIIDNIKLIEKIKDEIS